MLAQLLCATWVIDTRNVICTLYLRYPHDEGREYLLGVLFMVLIALICILFCCFMFYITFFLHFAQLDCKILVLSLIFFRSFIAFEII